MNTFKSDVINLHIKRTGVDPEIAEARWNGLDQTFKLCIKTGKPVVASEWVDEILHDALLFTEGYKNFCLTTFGKEIHHKPATIPGQPSGYLETRRLAIEKFGEAALQSDVWPDVERPQWSIIYTLD